MPNRIGGSIFVRNAIKFDYCIIEALESLYALCDEISILECSSGDETQGLLSDWVSRKMWGDGLPTVHLQMGHPWEVGEKYDRLAILANVARSALKTDWHFMLQADEVLHEHAIPVIRDLIGRGPNAYYFRRFNLFGTPDQCVRLDSNKKPCGDQVCRLAPVSSPVVGDAESIGAPFDVDNHYMKDLLIFHYGYVREGKKHIDKAIDMQSWFFGKGSTPDERIVKMKNEGYQFKPEVFFSPEDLMPIPVSHPKFSKELAKRLTGR